MIDLVYPLGPGSKIGNKELIYSLRSVDKYLNGFGRIYVIGENVPPLRGVEVIELDNSGFSREHRIFRKIMRACEIVELSENFLFMNDDHFFNRNTKAPEFSFQYERNLPDLLTNPLLAKAYKMSIKNTIEFLRSKGKPLKHFDIHVPIVYNKQAFQFLAGVMDWTKEHGYLIKSSYCNYFNMRGVEAQDFKLRDPIILERMESFVKASTVFSIGDFSLPTSLRLLEKLYPKKSQFEIVNSPHVSSM